ncbi:MAG TPA: TetR/AcrR family transcriptional regulator [Chromatiaceae bacterium]|jgi:AcrR family transcriptional regulator|nr:MAG: hypothetical protein N838_14405 [Thiohalocapsa sp. PB-PSB1]QQO57274.1 MAG: TetR/AcrR family transcriptional regulator [Thiohalocapsa sp. PB-PSB1]HBG94423.1 TetR/AcrR family transcriptional regulator [Chromatiaceae bacterium]HCS91823.1 TetR/AcrR family transcriptional regulator [Chromatiaceae bacterium]
MARRGEHSREQIASMALDAAQTLLEEVGPGGLTTRAVAKRIGYTAGSLYLVFRNRDDLVLQLNERTLDELRKSLDRALADHQGPEQRLIALGRCYLDFAQRHPSRWRFVFEHNTADPEQLPAVMRGKIDAFFQLISEQLSQRYPELDAPDLRRAAQTLWGGVHGIAMLAITNKLAAGGDHPARELVDDLIANYLLGLGSGRAGSR